MKRWLILAALVVAVSATATVAVQYLPSLEPANDGVSYPAPPKPTGPTPVAVIEGERTVEVGNQPQQTELSREWTIRNDGEADLVLNTTGTSCSCTAADIKDLVIKPHGSAKVHLTFNTKQFSGEYGQHATISSNDPALPTFNLGAHGTVHPALILFPPEREIPFMSLPNDAEHHYRFAISSADKPDFKITRIKSSRPGKIEATMTPLTDEDRKKLPGKSEAGGYQVNVTIKPGMPLGPFRDELIVETDHPKERELRLHVYGKAVGPIAVIPEHLRMTQVSGPNGGQGEVLLAVRGQRPTKFEVVKKPANLEVAVVPADENGSEGKYRLILTVPPGTKASEVDDLIVLKTDHPQAEAVKVPVTLYIRN